MRRANRTPRPAGGVLRSRTEAPPPSAALGLLIAAGLLVLLAAVATPARGQGPGGPAPIPGAEGTPPERTRPEGWQAYPAASGCLGGVLCRYNGEERRVRLEPRPVREVRFYAHDDVGPRSRGRLRVRLDRELLARELEIPRRGAVLTLDAVGLKGRELIFEVVGREEVVLEDVEVLYGPAGPAPWSPPTFESFLYP